MGVKYCRLTASLEMQERGRLQNVKNAAQFGTNQVQLVDLILYSKYQMGVDYHFLGLSSRNAWKGGGDKT